MQYQLVHHDGQEFAVMATSPDLQTEAQRDQWYANAVQGQQLPPGRQWAVIDPSHPWFQQPVPRDQPGSNETAPQTPPQPQRSPWAIEQSPAAGDPEPGFEPAGAGLSDTSGPDAVGPNREKPPEAKPVAGEQPDFNDIMKSAQARWNRERKEAIEDAKELQQFLSAKRKERLNRRPTSE